MLCGLALALVCGLAIAAPSLADNTLPNPNPVAPKLRQADWKLLAAGSSSVTANRIYYARVPSQTYAWKSRLSFTDRDTKLHQDFSHTGLLAIFLTSRMPGFTIDGVFPYEDGSLYVQIRAAPPPPPLPSCGLFEPCPAVIIPPPAPETPVYLLIAIRKGSLPAPVERLYITEVS